MADEPVEVLLLLIALLALLFVPIIIPFVYIGRGCDFPVEIKAIDDQHTETDEIPPSINVGDAVVFDPNIVENIFR
jgi:hypothetical protein